MLTPPFETGLTLTVVADPVQLAWNRTDYAVHMIDRQLAHRPALKPGDMWTVIRRIIKDHARLAPPRTPAGEAQVAAWLLRHRPGAFTTLLAAITGETVEARPQEGTDREYTLSGTEAVGLRVLDVADLHGWRRTSLLTAGHLACAAAELRLLPSRIGGWDGPDFERIRKGDPCGAVIPNLLRADRSAVSWWPTWPPVTAHAMLLSATGGPIGYADEKITPDLIAHLAAL
jgi:hypothetical protein